MRLFIIMFVLVTCSIACNPYKHYQGVASDPNVTEKKKQILAPWVGLYFPPEVKYVKGKDSIIVDTLIEIKDFDSLQNVIDLLLAKGFDSLEVCQMALEDLKRKCKSSNTITITKLRTDTVYRESGPMIDRLKRERDVAIANEIVTNTKMDDVKKQSELVKERSRNLWWVIIILALGLIGSIYLHFKRR